MKKDFFIKVLRFVLKYIVPALVGYLEGDTHQIQDGISSLF